MSENVSWIDPKTGIQHRVSEEGHLFRWMGAELNDKSTKIHDYGLVPGGAFIAIENLLESLEKKE